MGIPDDYISDSLHYIDVLGVCVPIYTDFSTSFAWYNVPYKIRDFAQGMIDNKEWEKIINAIIQAMYDNFGAIPARKNVKEPHCFKKQYRG